MAPKPAWVFASWLAASAIGVYNRNALLGIKAALDTSAPTSNIPKVLKEGPDENVRRCLFRKLCEIVTALGTDRANIPYVDADETWHGMYLDPETTASMPKEEDACEGWSSPLAVHLGIAPTPRAITVMTPPPRPAAGQQRKARPVLGRSQFGRTDGSTAPTAEEVLKVVHRMRQFAEVATDHHLDCNKVIEVAVGRPVIAALGQHLAWTHPRGMKNQ